LADRYTPFNARSRGYHHENMHSQPVRVCVCVCVVGGGEVGVRGGEECVCVCVCVCVWCLSCALLESL
jgi:hypothetical protein